MTTTIGISRNITIRMSKNATALEISDGKVMYQLKKFKQMCFQYNTTSRIMSELVMSEPG